MAISERIKRLNGGVPVSRLSLSGLALIVLCLAGMGFVFALGGLARKHWLITAGTADQVAKPLMPYIIIALGSAWMLLVLDAIFSGQLFWGRNTGYSDRKRSAVGFWLGIIFQFSLSAVLIATGIGMKFNPDFPLVSYHSNDDILRSEMRSRKRRFEHEFGDACTGCGGGATEFGEVVVVGGCHPFDQPK